MSVWATAFVLFVPLEQPVSVVADLPVYVICSKPIRTVPVVEKDVVLSNVIVVAELLIAPFKSVVASVTLNIFSL